MASYYNEHDPFAAAWLRELIKAGLIADGEVDERSIADVRADDLRGFVQCHFFAGIGGWSYALRLAGWPDDRAVWTGSCPCQPFSSAGAQAGGHDPRDLWLVWFQLLKECRPVVVFGEQVEAALGHGWLDRLCDDLEAEDYAVGACGLPGPCVGAFDIRQRLWFVAESQSRRDDGSLLASEREEISWAMATGRDGSRMAHAGQEQRGRRADVSRSVSEDAPERQQETVLDQRRSSARLMADSVRADGEWGTGGLSGTEAASSSTGRLNGRGADGPEHGREAGDMAHAESGGQRINGRPSGHAGHVDECESLDELGDSHDTRSQGRQLSAERGGERTTRPSGVASWLAESDESQSCNGELQRSRRLVQSAEDTLVGFWDACDWLPCADGKARPVEPGTFPLAHGVSARVGRLRGYGNAIKPQLAQVFIEAYMSICHESAQSVDAEDWNR